MDEKVSAADTKMFADLKKERLDKYFVFAGGEYRIRFLEPGSDAMVYIQGDRALLVDAGWYYPKNFLVCLVLVLCRRIKIKIFSESIKIWDNGEKVADSEKAVVLERVSGFIFERNKIRPTIV
jgi:hypothetical protein